MGWFKQNLFFAIGGLVALGLLAAAGFYDFKSWQRNNDAFAKLNELYTALKNNSVKDKNGHVILPGSDKTTNNIAIANEQTAQLREWMLQTTNYFQPIAPIPKPGRGPLTDPLFSTALHSNLTQLVKEAAAANVTLPPEFDFSFTAHVDRLTFAPGSLEPLSVQLGEVKTIAEVFFGAGVNALDGIQRVSVSPDDGGTPQTDYLADQPQTNDLAVLAPYQITFRAFSPEIARVFKGFAASGHGFIVKTINVQPVGGTTPAAGAAVNYNNPSFPPIRGIAASPQAGTLPPKGGSQTVQTEQLLSITMKVEVVKLTPKN
jgi:hypothetical protein